MTSPLSRGALIAGGSALALFVFMFFDWFADGGAGGRPRPRAHDEAAEQLGLDARDERRLRRGRRLVRASAGSRWSW